MNGCGGCSFGVNYVEGDRAHSPPAELWTGVEIESEKDCFSGVLDDDCGGLPLSWMAMSSHVPSYGNGVEHVCACCLPAWSIW